jgi:anti-sigma regulatory factor (Ser/Thr protein kinase)
LKPPDEPELQWLSLPGKTSSLERFRQFVLGQANHWGISESVQMKIDLVTEEVLLNVFNYAFEPGQTGEVSVGCGMVPEKGFLMRVTDPGRPFDPFCQEPPDTSLDIEQRKIGGLGIMLTRKMSSFIKYFRDNDRNVLDIYFKNQ